MHNKGQIHVTQKHTKDDCRKLAKNYLSYNIYKSQLEATQINN